MRVVCEACDTHCAANLKAWAPRERVPVFRPYNKDDRGGWGKEAGRVAVKHQAKAIAQWVRGVRRCQRHN